MQPYGQSPTRRTRESKRIGSDTLHLGYSTTHVQERRDSSRELRESVRLSGNRGRSATERVLFHQTLVLPIVPYLIYHPQECKQRSVGGIGSAERWRKFTNRMMQEEEWIVWSLFQFWVAVRSPSAGRTETTQITNKVCRY